jgi:hypothetical protein
MKKFNIIIILLFALSTFLSAQNPVIDSNLIHGLRELGAKGSEAYQETNYTGIENKEFQQIDKAAADLKAVIPKETASDFKVFDYGSYPILKFMNKANLTDELFAAMEVEVKKVTSNYLLIGKHLDPKTGKVEFKVKLSLPTVASTGNKVEGRSGLKFFDNLTEENLNEATNEILSVINSKNIGSQLDSKKAERAGIRAAKFYFGGGLSAKKVAVTDEGGITFAIGITPDNRAIISLPYKILKDKQKFVSLILPDNLTTQGFLIYEEEGAKKTLVHQYTWNNGKYSDIYEEDNQQFAELEVTLSEYAEYAKIKQVDINDDCFIRTQFIKFSKSDKPNSVAEISSKINDSDWKYDLLYTANETCLANFVEKTTGSFDCFGNANEIDKQKQNLENLFTIDAQGKLAIKPYPLSNIQIANTINNSCKTAIRALGKDKMLLLLKTTGAFYILSEQEELALLRLMACLETVEEYKDFYSLLENKIKRDERSISILQNILAEVHDVSIAFWKDQKNYTNFITALIWMYKTNPKAIEDRLPKSAGISEAEKENILSQIINIGRKTFKDDINGYTIYRNYKGVYDWKTGLLDLYEIVLTQKEVNIPNTHSKLAIIKNDLYDGDRKLIVNVDYTEKIVFQGMNPLTPIYIDYESDLPLVQTAMQAAGSNEYQGKLVPAIFFKFNDDKITNDLIEKGVMTTFDIITIFSSGGTVLATKIGWARRLWALAEVSGAVGNLAVTSGAVSNPTLKTAIESYNAFIGLIGLKNIVKSGYKGLRNLAKNGFPAKVTKALDTGADLTKDAELLEKYQTFKKEMGTLSNKDKDLIIEQEKLLDRLMGVANAVDDDFILFFKNKGIKVEKVGDIVEFSKNNTKFLEVSKDNLKVLDEASFQMDDVVGYGKDTKRMDYVKEVEIDNVKYQTDGVEVAVDANGKIRCAGNGTYCFAQDTPLPDGSLMSEKQEGDYITAYDNEKKTTTQAKISKIRRSFTSAFTRLWIAGSMLSVTPAHALQKISFPLERSGEVGEWVAAGQLQKGDYLRSTSGVVRLDSTFTESVTPTAVISYEVEGGAAYMVGKMPVVVASSCNMRHILANLTPTEWTNLKATLKGFTTTERSAIIAACVADANLLNALKSQKGIDAMALFKL